MTRSNAAITVLTECIATIVPLGPDSGVTATTDWVTAAWPTEGLVTLSVDSIRVSRTRTLQDHSTAQQNYDKLRVVKSSFTISIETKLLFDGLDLGFLTSGNPVVGLSVTSHKASFWVPCIVESFDVSYGNPSTLTMTLRSYGFSIQWDTDTEFPPPGP
jgi:hypothetical protein